MNRWLLLVLCGVITGCVSPYQTARTLAPGKTRVTAAGSNVHFSEENSDGGFDAIDLLVDHGVANRVELNVRYTSYGGNGGTANILSVGTKIGVVPDRVAVLLPVGVVWDEDDIGAYLFQPRILGSLPAGRNAELVGSLGFLVVFPDDEEAESDSYLTGSVGVRLSTDLAVWAVQPELSFTKFDEEQAYSLGAAFSFTM